MRLLFLLLTCVSALAQGGGYCTMTTWEPRNLVTKAGLVASYDPGNTATETFNPAGYAAGNGVSQMLDRAMKIRTGNLLLQSETFATTWTLSKLNAFAATDTGAAGAGSFANTARTTDPLGGNTADFIQTDATATTTHYIQQTFPASVTTGQEIISYVFAKEDTTSKGTNIMLYASVANVGKGFDLDAGTTVAVSGVTAPTSSSITSIGSGWYLCSIRFTAGASETLRINVITNSSGTYTRTYSGDNTAGVFIWGASSVRPDWTPVTGPTLAQGYQVTTTAAYAPPDLVQSTAANQPKISRQDGAGNMALQSEDFSTTWTQAGVNAFGAGSVKDTVATTDPLGGNTSDFIQEDSSTGVHTVSQTSITAPAGAFSYVVNIKPAGRTWTRLRLDCGADLISCYFQLAGAGAVGTAANGGGASGAAGTISTNYADGTWYRCKLSGTLSTSGAHTAYIYCSTGDTVFSYAGDNTSGLYLWGASLVPSTWTPVTGTSAALGYVATTTTPIFPGLGGRAVHYFDGSAYYMKTAAFLLNQPEEVYLLFNPWTFTAADYVFDGNATDSGGYYETAAQFNLTSGTPRDTVQYPPTGLWSVVRIGLSGANSYVVTNSYATPQVVGNIGAGNMGGFTLGDRGGAGKQGNILVARTLICNKTNAPAEANYLRWGLLKQAGLY